MRSEKLSQAMCRLPPPSNCGTDALDSTTENNTRNAKREGKDGRQVLHYLKAIGIEHARLINFGS